MNKLNKVLCLGLLLLMVLATYGCREDVVDAVPDVYWCMDSEVPEAAADGSYTLRFVCNGQQVSYRCTDAALAETICLQDVMGLSLDGETITGIRYMYNMPQTLCAWDYTVKSMGGGKVKLNSERSMNGGEVMIEITDQTKIYIVSPLADNPGEETDIQKYDTVTVISNNNDEAQIVFVSDRPYKADSEATYCQHCEQDVIWNAWLGEETMPTGSGHYRLEKDVTLKSPFKINGGKICIDLNGKRVEQTIDGNRIYDLIGAVELTIMDNVGTGVMRGTGAKLEGNYPARSGMVVNMASSDAVLNLYSGTLDGSGNPVQWGGVVCIDKGVFNMYGGTILGADPWSTGSGAVCVTGTFNLYDGKIVGGTQHDIGFATSNPKGGATIYSNGFFNMYGGIIEGGESPWTGGSVFILSGTTTLAGGTITGGKSGVSGSGVYVYGGATLKLSGSINITGNEGDNVCIGNGKLEIDEGALNGAKVGISMENPGKLAECSSEAVLDCLFSDDPKHKLIIRDGMLIME